LGFGV
jgi:hypothetical protein